MPASRSILGTCLPDAICNLIHDKDKKVMHSSLLLSLPFEGEATIGAMSGALAAHGMNLERASARFHNHKEGGSPTYHLMPERNAVLYSPLKLVILRKTIHGTILLHGMER